LSVQALSTSENLEATIGLYFGLLPSLNDTEFYERFQLRIQQLRCLKDRLSSLPSIQSNITFCLKQHENPRSGIAVAQVLRNLYGLLKYVHKLESEMESTLSQALDTHPDTTKEILRSVMTLVRIFFEISSVEFQCHLRQQRVMRLSERSYHIFPFETSKHLG
jgi:hypothetical protein